MTDVLSIARIRFLDHALSSSGCFDADAKDMYIRDECDGNIVVVDCLACLRDTPRDGAS
jgi:hypothetical protein